MVLSVPPIRTRTIPTVQAGDVLKFRTATTPDVGNALSALSGGPVLLRKGKWQPLPPQPEGKTAYQEKSKYERHPRTAIGWNDKYFFLIEVDGRQPNLSMGMTLQELGYQLQKLGCTDAMNLDGGGSAMLWANGRIQSSPSEGSEREIANALVVVRKGQQKANIQ
jgi:exopolysaccharide biosynthesis protein